jgi:nickel-dependent lactate racemase
MKVDFPYPAYRGITPADVPDDNLTGVYSPRAIDGVEEEVIIRDSLAHPIGADPLHRTAKREDRVLILVDDATRPTKVRSILPIVLEELFRAGVREQNIALLQATGSHRAMNDEELKQKLGPLYGRLPVFAHHWLDDHALASFGRTRDGTEVTASARLKEADLVIGLGSIVPHRMKGFSGGAKIAFPGVSGRSMMERNQWEASLRMSECVMGVADNPMRLRMEEAADLVGLRWIVDVVQDISAKIAGCFSGDVRRAHREGCRLSRELYAVYLPSRADIVLVDAHPADRDFWQSVKGVYAGTMAVKDAGSMILVAPNPEGVASNHPIMLEIGYRSYREILAMVERSRPQDMMGLSILADVCQIVDKTDCILASPGVTQKDARKIGFRYAHTPTEAVRMALERQGRNARIAVLRHGGHVLPLVLDERTLRP